MRALVSVLIMLACGVAGAQGIPGYQAYTPGSTAVVQQVVQPAVAPQYGAGYAQPSYSQPGLPVQNWNEGMHEEFRNIHEIRPIREWEAAPQQQYYQQQVVYPQQQQQWYCPQQQQQWYCPQQYQQQYYCPQQCGSWHWCPLSGWRWY